jgi:hypothetical protein
LWKSDGGRKYFRVREGPFLKGSHDRTTTEKFLVSSRLCSNHRAYFSFSKVRLNIALSRLLMSEQPNNSAAETKAALYF